MHALNVPETSTKNPKFALMPLYLQGTRAVLGGQRGLLAFGGIALLVAPYRRGARFFGFHRALQGQDARKSRLSIYPRRRAAS